MSPAAVKSETPDLDKFRDELAEAHKPADGYERMLVSEIAQAWFRLEKAREVEQRYCSTRDMVEVITTKLEEFKAITRYVAECERAWRHAVESLERSQHRRQRLSQ